MNNHTDNLISELSSDSRTLEDLPLIVGARFHEIEGEDYYLTTDSAHRVGSDMLKDEDRLCRLAGLVEVHEQWYKRENLLCFARSLDRNNADSVGLDDNLFLDPKCDGDSLCFRPSVKVGDRHWRKQQKKKLEIGVDYLQGVLEADKKHNTTNMGFLTLTVDPKKFKSEIDAWIQIKKSLDVVIKRLKRRGVIDYIRIIESHSSGYPHVHMIVVFSEIFRVLPHGDGAGGVKYLFPNSLRLDIRESWEFGFIDLHGVMSARSLSGYLMKDMIKNTSGRGYRHTWKADLSHAFLWYCGMRFQTYSKAISDLIKAVKKNSPEILSDSEKIVQMRDIGYVFIGVVPLKFLVSRGFFLERVPEFSGFDPPDALIDVLCESYEHRHPDRGIPIELLSLYGTIQPQKTLVPFDILPIPYRDSLAHSYYLQKWRGGG